MPLQQQDELSDEEFMALASGAGPSQGAELSDDEFIALASGGAPAQPQTFPQAISGAYSGIGSALAGYGLEGLSSIAGFGSKVVGSMDEPALGPGTQAAIQKATGAPVRQPEPGLYSGAVQGAAGLLGQAEQALGQKAQEVFPPEERERQGMYGQVIGTIGQMATAAPAVALGAIPAAFVFAAQNAMPAYYEVLKKTGDEEKANKALWGNAAIGQLEFLGGGERVAGGLLKKLMTGDLGKAIRNGVLHFAVTEGKEVGTELAQQGLSDLLHENLTGEDLANWERLKATAPVALLASAPFAVVDSALGRAPSVATPAPPATQAAQTTAQRTGTVAASKTTPATTTQAEAVPVSSVPPVEEKAGAEAATNPAPAVVAPETVVGGPEAPATTQPEESQAHVGLAAAEATQLVGPSSEGVSQAENIPTQAAAEETVPEAEPETQTTGIKKEVVERELKKMGIELPPGPEGESRAQWHADALAKTKEDPEAGRKLVDELEAHPRATDKNENALLNLEANKRLTAWEKAADKMLEEPSEVNETAEARAREDYKKAAEVFKRSGTTWGHSGQAMQMLIARDESLAGVERALRTAKKGELTAKEHGVARGLAKELKETREAFETYVSEREAKDAEAATRAAQLEAENVMLKEKKSIISKKKRKDREAKILESKKRIDEILNKLASGHKAAAVFDPAKLALTVQLAAEHIRLGYQSFNLWADEVVAKVGEHIRPYLRPAWDQAKEAEEQAMLKSYKSRKETDIAKIEERIATKRFDIKKRQTPIEKDPEAIRLKAEYERAKRRYGSEKRKFERGARTKAQKLMGGLYEIMALPRALRFSYDLPPVFRQGMFFGVQDLIFNPIAEIKRIGAGISAMSLRKAERIDAKLRIGRTAELAEAAGLELPSVEEEMASEIAKRLPGIQASSRIYNTYMNLQRMAKFEAMTGAIPNLSMHEAKQIARGINILTGRGNAKGGLGAAIDGLGSILTSPRLLISRFQMLAGAPMYGGTGRTRRAFARQYAKTLAAYAAFYSLAKLAGELFDEDVEIHWDPRTSDFGKIIVGEKRYDVMGGLAQITTLLGRTLKGEKAGLRGKNVKPIRGEDVPFKGDDATDLLKEFLRYKLSPTAGAVVDVATGKQVERDEKGKPLPVTAGSVAKSLAIPVSVEDIPTELRRLGIRGMVQNRLISAFGVGVRDYYGELKRARR